ncbi:MAG: MucB/RseB C-terminal domain-containing protein [Pseudomonadales bacterium]|nr:MucB/RseB C-terminal domain-containing protein [Pseudomonadales bacterium]
MKAILHIGVLAICVVASSCYADEVSDLLEKMGSALREQNYEGTFTYMRGSQFETIRVTHQFADGSEDERLLNLNGEPREVIRHDGEVMCHHVNSAVPEFDHNVPLGPFSHAFNENLLNSQAMYRFTLLGKDRIADRSAVRLQVIPRFNDRFGYQLWLDEATGLLLQSQLVQQNRVLEFFQFSDITIGEPFELAGNSSLGNDTVSHELFPKLVGESAKPGLRVSWLPDGFKQVSVQDSNRLHFTDGLAAFSIFIERSNASLPEMTTHRGGTTVITRTLKGAAGQITVVGEVPISTARKVVESVEPVIF